jgi:hypothetical protein
MAIHSARACLIGGGRIDADAVLIHTSLIAGKGRLSAAPANDDDAPGDEDDTAPKRPGRFLGRHKFGDAMPPPPVDVGRIIAALGGGRRNGNGWICHCPVHDDRTPSLSVAVKNGRLLVHCHASCSQDAVIAELKRLGLWPKTQPLGPIVATYDYLDQDGVLRYQVTKHLGPEKTFRQRRPDGRGGWIDNIKRVTRLPYRLPELLAADPNGIVVICEGEKDVDNVRTKLGFTATCNSMGAMNWQPEISHWLKDRDVVIVPDNDPPGRAHVQDVAKKLTGIAARIRILSLPGLGEKESDWIASDGTADLFMDLVAAAPDWAPEPKLNGAEPPPPEPEEADAVTVSLGEMNEGHALVLVGNKTVILREGLSSEGTPTFWLLQIGAFHAWCANKFITVGQQPRQLSKYWMTWRGRREYQGIVFAPGHNLPNYFNLWRGFAVEPRKGDCLKFLAHLKDNICSGDDAHYRWVIGWLADIVQHPDKKCGTSLVIRGKPGVGKTKVGQVMARVLGSHYFLVADPRYIVGRFNAHLISLLLLHADEGFWAGDHAAEGKLKDMITGDYLPIEFKGIETFRVRNHVRLLVTGNPDWLVPAAMEERRFCVLDASDAHREDFDYFAAIDAEMDNGGAEALLHHLLNVNLSGLNLRSVPKTEALLDQKIASLSSEKAWWLDVLMQGHLPWGCDRPNETPATAIHKSYVKHAQDVGERRRSIETRLGIFLKKAVPHTPDMIGLSKREGGYTALKGKRVTGTIYVFPDLPVCRSDFVKLIGQPIAWNDPDANWVFFYEGEETEDY